MPRQCKCSGSCVPQVNIENTTEKTETGVSRREFISLSSIGLVGAVLTGTTGVASARDALPQNQEVLANWKRGLFQPAVPRRYRSDTHKDARMPLGGIGTGNVEIGADGQITTWQLFNTLRDGYVPFFFGVKVGKRAKLLQTAGGPEGLPRIKSIEMTGEYPCASLRFEDGDLPVHLEMTAFTPFAPIDTSFSSMPVACFVFKVHNPTGQEQSVSLAGFMQNPVGYDAIGPALAFPGTGLQEHAGGGHPNFGGNINELKRNCSRWNAICCPVF